jgi:hypothetical protein
LKSALKLSRLSGTLNQTSLNREQHNGVSLNHNALVMVAESVVIKKLLNLIRIRLPL